VIDPASLARIVRRVGFPVGLALLRLRKRRGAAPIAAAGACALAATLGGATVVQERSLARAVERIPAAERVVRVWAGVPALGAPAGGLPPLDAAAREAVGRVGTATAAVTWALLLRETRVGGALVDLAAADGLGRWVRLSAGRLPGACRPARCEVVQLGGGGRPPVATLGLRLVVVGSGVLVSDVPFGVDVDRSALSPALRAATGYHQPPQPPLLVAGDVAGLAAVPELAPIYRSVAWIAPLPAAAAWHWSGEAF
jgi:hypothetical protein